MAHISQTKLPSFSLIYETENLCSVELENIYRSLASLAAQTISITDANEFLIIDGGYAPDEVIRELCDKYPWITIKRISGIGYYEAKMMGAELATGDIIIYCDSDCVYASNWLQNILTIFAENSDINILAGETSTPVRNSYELAIALHYFFPRYTQKEQIYTDENYFNNNVAFRRDFLLANPLPTDLKLYRGNCHLHSYNLRKETQDYIWKSSKIKASHEPPNQSFINWRYLLLGHDRAMGELLIFCSPKNASINDYMKLSNDFSLTLQQKLFTIILSLFSIILFPVRLFNLKRLSNVLRENWGNILILPLALLITLWFELLYTIGKLLTYLKPGWLLDQYQNLESS